MSFSCTASRGRGSAGVFRGVELPLISFSPVGRRRRKGQNILHSASNVSHTAGRAGRPDISHTVVSINGGWRALHHEANKQFKPYQTLCFQRLCSCSGCEYILTLGFITVWTWSDKSIIGSWQPPQNLYPTWWIVDRYVAASRGRTLGSRYFYLSGDVAEINSEGYKKRTQYFEIFWIPWSYWQARAGQDTRCVWNLPHNKETLWYYEKLEEQH